MPVKPSRLISKGVAEDVSFLHKALAKTFWLELDKIYHNFVTNFISDKTP